MLVPVGSRGANPDTHRSNKQRNKKHLTDQCPGGIDQMAALRGADDGLGA